MSGRGRLLPCSAAWRGQPAGLVLQRAMTQDHLLSGIWQSTEPASTPQNTHVSFVWTSATERCQPQRIPSGPPRPGRCTTNRSMRGTTLCTQLTSACSPCIRHLKRALGLRLGSKPPGFGSCGALEAPSKRGRPEPAEGVGLGPRGGHQLPRLEVTCRWFVAGPGVSHLCKRLRTGPGMRIGLPFTSRASSHIALEPTLRAPPPRPTAPAAARPPLPRSRVPRPACARAPSAPPPASSMTMSVRQA